MPAAQRPSPASALEPFGCGQFRRIAPHRWPLSSLSPLSFPFLRPPRRLPPAWELAQRDAPFLAPFPTVDSLLEPLSPPSLSPPPAACRVCNAVGSRSVGPVCSTINSPARALRTAVLATASCRAACVTLLPLAAPAFPFVALAPAPSLGGTSSGVPSGGGSSFHGLAQPELRVARVPLPKWP
jgi:hypothetical protein